MRDGSSSTGQRVRLFRAAWLELGTLTPFPVFAVAWSLLLVAGYIWAARAMPAPVLLVSVLAGFAVWFVFEYLMHRVLFHFDARSPLLRRLIFLLHENHHEDPNDPLRGLMPLPVSLPIAALIGLAGWSLGRPGEGVALGFVSGYVLYDAVHWACHHCRMDRGLGLRLKRHHLRHHFAAPRSNFAVTAIFLDRWFGTGFGRR